jgi:hypothetical protein
MIKKICFLILSAAIVTAGVIAFSKLSYWERSVRIFSFSSNTTFEGRRDRGPDGRGEFFLPEMGELPDSIRSRFEAEVDHPGQGMRDRDIPDSLRQQFGPQNGEQQGRGHFEGGIRNGEIRGRGEFPGGKKINIKNLKWFPALFASFTVIIIYIDKAIGLIRRRKGRQLPIS